VAATALLAFTLEDAPGAPLRMTIEPGTRVQSVPGPGELPQTFETGERVEVRAAWSFLRPRPTRLRAPAAGNTAVLIKGTATGLRPGDGLLVVGPEREQDPGSERWNFRLVKTIATEPATAVEIDRCIVGGVRAITGAEVRVAGSIMDATAAAGVAYAAPDGAAPGAPLDVRDSNVVGKVWTGALRLACNCIFLAAVTSERRQQRCVRFSFLPLESRVPRRERCRPETPEEAEPARPCFTCLHFGAPGYGQLAAGCPATIRVGADDEGEMGAFHALQQPRRERDLRVRLDECLRLGLEAGCFTLRERILSRIPRAE
jgi:hypothetical protein